MNKRFVLSCIALNQLALSLLVGWLALLVPYGGGLHPLLAAYALWGLISACALFSARARPKIIALPWHLLFVGYVLVHSLGQQTVNQGDRIIQIWAMGDLLAVIYTRTVIHYFRKAA
jgi:hypothetical protein